MNSGLNIKTTFTLGLLIIVSLSLTDCAGKLSKAKRIADPARLNSKILNTSKFTLQSFYRFSKKGAPLTVYIEGDGLAWLNRNQPSMDPTPRNPLALRLAALDKSDNVLYLARPCQYVDLYTEKLCSIPYWTQKRFAREVIISIDEAINKITSMTRSKNIHMIGYSGGGAIVAMVAAVRKDIASIRTVAGYMDHVALNHKMNVSQLIGSLDPIKAAPKLDKIPQIHYSGRRDKRMPGWVLTNFRKAVGSRKCVTLKRVDANHEEGWEEVWEKLWSKMPECRK